MAVPCPLHDDIQNYMDHRKFLIPNAPNAYINNLLNYNFYRHVTTDYETPILIDLQGLCTSVSGGGDDNIDGGGFEDVYLAEQLIDGGSL